MGVQAPAMLLSRMKEFLASMPAAYARAFTRDEVVAHARIVARRGAALAHAELCQGPGRSLVCVVADDRPGLLALLTDALLVQAVGIRSAQVYCRARADGSAEAVDFLELQVGHAGAGFEASELEAFKHALSELIAEDIQASVRASAAPVVRVPPARAYFELEALRRNQYVLLVEAPDSQGLLHGITSALHAQGVRILSCQIGTEAGTARDRFELATISGERLTAVELCDLQLAVLDSLPSPAGRE
jgi:UTP:GlnB (protein PII) uridylyltransferase